MADTLLLFNIQRYSLHDGTGIRTVFFLKGCPLRCRWCCNPESQKTRPELMYRKTRCIGSAECGACRNVCPAGAIHFEENEYERKCACVDFDRCTNCFACTGACPSQALQVEGKAWKMDDLLDLAEQDASFYASGGGGITLSGGEPLSQEKAVHFLRKAKERYLNTAVETCGYVPLSRLIEAAAHLDQIFYDIKSMDDEKHRLYTGVSGARIRENLKVLCETFPRLPKTVRTPVIPGFNDSREDLDRIEHFLEGLPGVTWQKLPYHTYGAGKYEMLGRRYPMDSDQGSLT